MKKKKRILVTVSNDLATDNRVDKVCTFLHQHNFEVLLIGAKRKNRLPLTTRSYATKRITMWFDAGAFFYAELNIRLLFTLLFRRSTHILANDLDTLLAAYIASKLKCNKLIYDTHEYFTEVPELTNRPRIKRIWERIEKWIFPKVHHVYTVNESIAKRYAEKYQRKVFVVRNVSRKWNPTHIQPKEELGIPENCQLLIVQGAGIHIDRGIEEVVEAMKYTQGLVLMIVGDGDVIPQLKNYVTHEKLSDKVRFYGKRPYAEMMQYTHYADIGLTLDKDTNLNYRFSLPNKVFDYIHASTPVISSDLPEIRKVITQFDVGTFIPSHNPNELGAFLMQVCANKAQLAQWKSNCHHAASVLCWENEEQTLHEIYTCEK